MEIKQFFKNAFSDMKESAKAQREVDKANFQATKAEAKANFEENRGKKTFARAKADAKKTWDEAHTSPAERTAKMQQERAEQLNKANERKALAEQRIQNAKEN